MAPAGLLSVSAACCTRTKVNTIGVVVDKLDVYKTRGSSYGVTFTIKDSDFDAPTWQGGLKVKYFNDNQSVLPVVQVNDVVLLRGIRIGLFQGRETGVASQNDVVHWAIFRPQPGSGENLSISRGPYPFELDSNEKKMATVLLASITGEETPKALQSSPAPAPQQPTTVSRQTSSTPKYSAPPRKSGFLPFSLIQDVQVGQFTQLLGQVVKMNTYNSDKTLIYLTDYTTNTSLMDIRKDDDESGIEGDEYGYLTRKKQNWPGPWGQLSIQVALWEPHASFAREYVKEGCIVNLTYVHIKEYNGGGIEAAVHRDKRFEDKIHIHIVSEDYDERARDLMARRKAYWKVHGKPKIDNEQNTKPNKIGRKSAEQQQTKPKQRDIRREEGQGVLSKPPARKKTNPNIQCRDYGIPIRDVDSILSAETHMNEISGGITYRLPFQNVCYRPLVRVVDFYPPKLEDFAVQVPVNPVAGYDDDDQEDLGPKYTTWDWRFCLLVEGTESTDPKNQNKGLMQILVTAGEGTHLLSLDADDLRNNPDRLNELREKLFLLWGDLEERKREASSVDATGDDESWMPVKSSSLPFICCIKEYGVKCSHQDPDAMVVDDSDQDMCSHPECLGWERRFAMFGTTIHS